MSERLTAEHLAKIKHASPFVDPPAAGEHLRMMADELTALRAEVARLRADRERLADTEAFLEREGYRFCDIAACHCGLWHGGHAADRLREISETLAGAGVPGGTTIHGSVLILRERAKQAEAENARLGRRINGLRDDVLRLFAQHFPEGLPTVNGERPTQPSARPSRSGQS